MSVRSIIGRTELKPEFGSSKSFYKRAYVLTRDDGIILLKSYDTIVAYINPSNNTIQFFGWYSRTTSKHIQEFVWQYATHSRTRSLSKQFLNDVASANYVMPIEDLPR